MTRLLAVLLALCALASALHAGQPIDDAALRLPAAGDYALRALTPSLLELTFISAPPPDAKPLALPGEFRVQDFQITIDEQPAKVAELGFKRRVLYAPLKRRDLRVATHVYLQLAEPLPEIEGRAIKVVNPKSPLWPDDLVFTLKIDRLRYSPAIHVNQEGYTPKFPKLAQVGYYLGDLGEMPVPADAGFELVDARSGKKVFSGKLVARRDVGFASGPRPYQKVFEANFTDFDTPGFYRLVVPGLGASLPFHVHEGALLNFARAYALGLYHQRCGCANEMPFTRFTHDACHTAPAEVPLPWTKFAKAWETIGILDRDLPPIVAPATQLKDEKSQLYPFVGKGKLDVSGGHHDAGDYSKYLTNSTTLLHALMFAVDALPGVAELDNLGLPESGDGISDLLQEAKWESDYIAKMQDEDGGFYFLVYPRDIRYEIGTPDQGSKQIVWPKNTAATAAAVAALAQSASSPLFRKHFPEDAKRYLKKAELGWKFLMTAIGKHGKAGAYQRLTHYGDHFQHDDELAWAACELFLATGAEEYHQKLLEWYPDPTAHDTRYWGWWRGCYGYGNALRSYAFAARSKRQPLDKLDAGYLAKCEAELKAAGDDALQWSQQNAYGLSYPEASKRHRSAGWFFASDWAFDMTVAHQLRPRPEYVEAVLANLNYEAGSNPVNISFITGLGQRRQREMVHQYALADPRVLPPSGIPFGSLQSRFHFMDHYRTELRQLSYPSDEGSGAVYPLYDRWSDSYNLTTEFVINNQGRSLASLAYWAAQTPAKKQKWKSGQAKILVPDATMPLHRPVTLKLAARGLDLADARIVWEARDQEPAMGPTYTIVPTSAGQQWVEAEAHWPDGRRVFAQATFRANSPVVTWVEGELPLGAKPFDRNGDEWKWIEPASKPEELIGRQTRQHQSAIADGPHDHGFENAEATLTLDRGDILFAYVNLDPEHPPKTVMLMWKDDDWEHRAYWGPNLIPWGHEGTASQRKMGPLPKTGEWVRLEVPASAVGLEGRTLTGMTFMLHSGRATWDAAGKMTWATKELGLLPLPPLPDS